MQRCTKCGETKELLDFGSGQKLNGKSSHCKTCINNATATRRLKYIHEGKCGICGELITSGNQCIRCSKRQNFRHLKARRDRKRKAVELLGGACNDCGYSNLEYITVFEFHHLDPSTKLHDIAQLFARNKHWPTVVEELQKCILLCSNCHRTRHEIEDAVRLMEYQEVGYGSGN